MTDASLHALGCRRGMKHHFDYYSGWCHNGCGNRDDGRVTSFGGTVLHPGPTYTEKGLDRFRERLQRKGTK